MTEIIVPIIGADGAFTGDGLGAAQRVYSGITLNICSPEFGADPTGVAVKPLSGRLALGAYYAGTNAASATFGEVALFSTALTDTQVAGVSAYLGKKWG